MKTFKDHPDFTPNLSPSDIFMLGSFGGTYWRSIYSSVTGQNYKDQHKEFPKSWWQGIPDSYLTRSWDQYDKTINRYDVKVGSTLEYWEKKGWIHPQDPYGWVQWYCRFYRGRRTEDDRRQINRWKKTAGPNSRFKKRLENLIAQGKDSPKIRQTLQHWAVAI